MAFNPLHGKQASINTGGSAQAFDEFEIEMADNVGEVSNFTGGGKRQWVSGLQGATLNISGPYDEGNMPFTLGTTYTVTLTFVTSVSISVSAILKNIKPTVNVDKPQRVQLVFQVTGAFGAALT